MMNAMENQNVGLISSNQAQQIIDQYSANFKSNEW